MYFTTQGISFHSLKFIDFVPTQLKKGSLFTPSEYDRLDDLLGEIDKWIEANPEIMILNVETVVLPNIHHHREEGSEDPELVVRESDGGRTRWHQFFRVWYK